MQAETFLETQEVDDLQLHLDIVDQSGLYRERREEIKSCHDEEFSTGLTNFQ